MLCFELLDDAISLRKVYAGIRIKGDKLMSEKLEFLIKQVHTELEKFDKKRNRYRRYLILSKIITASLTALITVLLGLTFGLMEIEIWLKNVALVISAFLTVLTTLDALYDFQSRHVSNHIAYKRLQELVVSPLRF